MTYRTITDVLNLAEELFEAKKFKEVLDALGGIDYNSISPEDRARCNLFNVEANYYLGNFDIEPQLNEALDYYKRSRDDEKFARSKYLKGHLLMMKGEYIDAREELIEAFTMYRRHDRLWDMALVSNLLGRLCFQLGDLEAAENHIKKSIDIYRQLGDTVSRIQVSGNLSTIYCFGGYLTRSIEISSSIATQACNRTPRSIASFLIQFSIPNYLKGDYKSAHELMDKSLKYIEDTADLQAIYLEARGEAYYFEGRYEEAREVLVKAHEMTEKAAPKGTLMANIKELLSRSLIDLNELDAAGRLNEEVYEIAEKINERPMIAAYYRNRGRLEALKGNAADSREWFRKSIILYSAIKTRFELSLARYQAAMSGVFPPGERHAFLYLAREYFESEDVGYMVKKINTEINNFQIMPRAIPDWTRAKLPRIVTVNDEMKRILSMAEHIAPSDMSVLLTGATGTGKDMLARYIHHHSGRTGRFVSINAAAIPDSMVESELFGHRRGAFTNADRDKVGLIEVAHDGTLYLNEIADASKELQAKLLDVLENHTIRRLGETKEREVAFRLIAATNHDLTRLIDDGKFRVDLYHRISEVPFSLPPLAERKDDIPVLLAHFLTLAGVEVDTENADFQSLARLLSEREWPGNVRQIEAESKRLALLSRGDAAAMPQFVSSHKLSERDQLYDLLRQTNWNRREVARKLGVSDTTIRRKIRKFKLDDE
jgi:transcriptional regulator with AAA-type ATPase domain